MRLHRTLELAEDKFYVITCGKAGFKNARNETSLVSLKLIDKNRKVKVNEVLYGHEYIIRADISRPDGKSKEKTQIGRRRGGGGGKTEIRRKPESASTGQRDSPQNY